MSLRLRASAALVLLFACVTGRALAVPCPGIAPDTAQRLFDRMKQVPAGGGYRFEGVGTDKSAMVVQWSLDGKDCPPIAIDVGNCASLLGQARLRLHVPPEVLDRCPGLPPVVTALSSAVAAEHPVGQYLRLPPWAVRPLIAVIALIGLAGLLIRRLLAAAAGNPDWGDVGWVAVVLLVALPFFFNLLPAVTVELGVAWIVFAVLLYDRELVALPKRTRLVSLLALFCFALLLNCSLSSGGPGDLHLNLAAIWSSGIELRWGPAPVALFRLLGIALGGIHDTAILRCNLLLSALLPVLLSLIALELGVGELAALAAGFVVAAHPLPITFSGVLGRQPTYLFAAFGSVLALIGFLQRARGRQLVAFVLGAVLATTSRPEGAHVLVLYIAALLVVPAGWRTRAVVVLALALFVPFAFGYTRYALELQPAAGRSLLGEAPILWTILFDGDFTPLAWIVAWAAGLVLGMRARAGWFALLSLLGFDIVWRWANVYSMFVGVARQVASSRYETILLVPFAIGIALLMQTVLEMRTWWRVGFAAVFLAFTVATFSRPYETLLRPFTVDHEYRFLKRQAAALPPGSLLYVFDAPTDDTGFLDAHLVGQFAGSAVSFGNWSARDCDALRRGTSPAYLYIGSSCAELVDAPGHPLPPNYAGWLQQCAAMRARVSGDLVEEIDVPARKMSWHQFKDAHVPLALYRLRDASLCGAGETTDG